MLRQEGFQLEERGGSRPDGGVDLVATRASERRLVQCKHWKTRQIPVSVVREMFGVLASTDANPHFSQEKAKGRPGS